MNLGRQLLNRLDGKRAECTERLSVFESMNPAAIATQTLPSYAAR